MAGKIYLIPTVLSEDAIHVIPAYVHEITKTLNCFIVENPKTARRYLRKTGFSKSFDEVEMFELNEHSTAEEISAIGNQLTRGIDIGIMSEAGVPAVADPGHEIVRIAHQQNIRVVPLVGPSSIILALMASGLNGQQFIFHGYLPVKQNERVKKIAYLEQRSKSGETQLFIETPYRNNSMIKDVINTCGDQTIFCIASDLTGANENVRTKTIAEWRKANPSLEKIPAIFLIGNFVS